MISYTTRQINTISIFISIIIFYLINSIWINFSSIKFQVSFNSNNLNIVQNEFISTQKSEEVYVENSIEEETKEIINKNSEWSIEIPIINLYAEISEGTTQEVLNQYVGHFEETVKNNGNVGLAGHNRGYDVNYFQDLKKLNYGDEIIYTYKDFKLTYIVDTIEIIKNTDWSYLENTEKNKITLITCIENEPNYRRCIQATEKTESEDV